MSRFAFAVAAILLLGVLAPVPAGADHREHVVGNVIGDVLGDIIYGDDDYHARDRGRGPAFCRSGAGHPVHGRDWCYEKGFGMGSSHGGGVLDAIIYHDDRYDDYDDDHGHKRHKKHRGRF